MIAYQVHDPLLSQYTYLVAADESDVAVVIDPACDIERYEKEAERHNLRIAAAFETHFHADFLSGLRAFAERGVPVYASDAGRPDVRYDWLLDSSYAYHLLNDGDTATVGGLTIEAMHTPGHTPEHLSYLLYDGDATDPLAIATGDFLFVGGTGCTEPANGQSEQAEDDQCGNTAANRAPDASPSLQAAGRSHSATEPPSVSGIAPPVVERFRALPSSTHVWPLHSAGTLCGYAPSSWPISTVWRECQNNPFLAPPPSAAPDHALRMPPTPPAYFRRVRRRNRVQPPVDCAPPSPTWVSPETIAKHVGDKDTVFLDTRPSATAFQDDHLLGALHTPITEDFLKLAGTYTSPSDTLYLILDAQAEAKPHLPLQALARIGLTNVAGLFPQRLLTHLPAWTRVELPVLRRTYLPDLARHPGVAVVDVRMPGAYTRQHTPGSMNIPYTQLPTAAHLIPDDAIVIVEGASDACTTAAAAYLQHKGHDVGCAQQAVFASA